MIPFFNKETDSIIDFNTLKELAHKEYTGILKNHIGVLKDLSLDELDQLMKIMASVKAGAGNKAAVLFTILEKKLVEQLKVTTEEEEEWSFLISMLHQHIRVKINNSHLEVGFITQPVFCYPFSYVNNLPPYFQEPLIPQIENLLGFSVSNLQLR